MVRLGVVLILLAFAMLFGLFLFPNLLTPLTALYCPAGETLTRSTFTFAIPNETSITLYFHCTDAQGIDQIDVSGQVTWSIIGLFLVTELGGFALTTIGGKRKHHPMFRESSERGAARSERFRFAQHEEPPTLIERLRQLRDAHSEGLLDDDEYQKLRQEAMDKLN